MEVLLAHGAEGLGENLGKTIVSLIFGCCTPQKKTQQHHVATTLQATELHLDRRGRLKAWEESAIQLAKKQLCLKKNISG